MPRSVTVDDDPAAQALSRKTDLENLAADVAWRSKSAAGLEVQGAEV
jgi:hypothetical protein